MSDTCRSLLQQSQIHAPLCGNRLANHLPMALLALDRLGSSGDYPRFVRFFQERIREAGVDAVLHDWVPVLMPGLAASAFHAMIRLAYAIEGGLEDEIAPALAGAAVQPADAPALRDVARFALQAYAQREDFTLLHIVTGTHAFRIVQAYVCDQALARRYLRQAPQEGIALEEREIAARALRSRDDHVIKLCHSALREYVEYGDAGYLQVATRKLELDV
jgi:hypothetical protein